jgi:predicted dehydrogenase
MGSDPRPGGRGAPGGPIGSRPLTSALDFPACPDDGTAAHPLAPRRPHRGSRPGVSLSASVLIGILGCGRAAERLHLPALAGIRDARLTAAYDPGPERRELIARAAPGCRPFESAAALLAARLVDAVIVSSPPDTHADLAVQALRAGVPVLVDAPLAPTLDEAAWIRGEERASGAAVMVGFNRRWWAPAVDLRHLLSAGLEDASASADTLLVTDRVRSGEPGSADALHDLVVHHLDLLRFLMDRELATVRAQRDAAGLLTLEMTFHGGGTAACRAGFGERAEESVTVTTDGRRHAIRGGSSRHTPAEGVLRRSLDGLDEVRRRLGGQGDSLGATYARQLRGFISFVRGEAPPIPGTVDGIAAVQAVEAARLSLEHAGGTIEVPPTPDG